MRQPNLFEIRPEDKLSDVAKSVLEFIRDSKDDGATVHEISMCLAVPDASKVVSELMALELIQNKMEGNPIGDWKAKRTSCGGSGDIYVTRDHDMTEPVREP